MRAGFARMFLNEGEKENKRRGDRDRTLDTCVEEKNKKKKKKWKKEMKLMDENEMKERKNNIQNKTILIDKCYNNIFTIDFK